MRNKIFIILTMLGLSLGIHAENQAKADSLKAAAIDKEAEDPDFVHAYLLYISPGKAFYSVYGHAAIRLVCQKKSLDYCFSFEMDMKKSSYLDVFRRQAKAGYFLLPTTQFLNKYQEEGRGITAYELNLAPREKQNLWRFLDTQVGGGATWTFNCTSVTCLSMTLYAIGTAIQPSQIEYKHLPSVLSGEYTDWIDYVSRRSPWVRLILRSALSGVDGKTVDTEDKLAPEMLDEVLPQAIITDSIGKHPRSLIAGEPTVLNQATYQDAPCWFRPYMALILLVIVIVAISFYIHRKRNHNKLIGNQHKKV